MGECIPGLSVPRQSALGSVTYLGRSTHRVAISSTRLLSITDELITFRTRGEGTCAIPPHEFIRRFLLHVLPEHFVKIRHYGLLAPGNINVGLCRAQALLAMQSGASSSFTDFSAAAAHSLREHNDDTTVDLTRPRCPNCGVRSLVLRGARRTGYRQLRRSDPPPDT